MLRDTDPAAHCATLARELMSADSPRVAGAVLRRWSEVFAAGSAAGAPSTAGSVREASVGIWRPTQIDVETWFVRDPHARNAHLWADVEQIGPKCSRKRVVLLGESCARGVPLDPYFNCAAALRAYFRAAGSDTVEIVDLAQCGLSPAGLVGLLEASRALDPDLYVVFAGNNWVVTPEGLDFDAVAASLLEARSWLAVRPHCERAVRARVGEWMTAVATACRESGIPSLFVLPAENIEDCPLPRSLYNPLLDSAEQAKREALIAAIDRACVDGAWATGERLASELVALEDGCSVVGLQALARCARARGEIDEAVRLFTAGREVLASLPVGGLSSYTTRSDEMRVRAAGEALPIVDLPTEFVAMSPGRIPGRDLFFDHCHMTAAGIVAAMSATAEAVLPWLGLPATSRHALREVPLDIDARAHAQGHFVAARMNAHYDDLVRHHCARAVESGPAIAEAMRQYADVRVRRRPAAFSEAFRRLRELERPFPALRFLDLSDPFTPRDIALMRLMAQAMGRDDRDALLACEALTARERAVGAAECSLLPYAATGEFEDVLPPPARAYEKYFRRKVAFRVFAAASTEPWRLRMTTRARHPGSAGKEAVLRVNGTRVCAWMLRLAWSTVHCVVDPRLLKPGENELTIVWPDPGERRPDRVRHVHEAFSTMKMLAARPAGSAFVSHVYTTYGEMHAFTAVAVGSAGGNRTADDRAAQAAVPKLR